MMQDSIQNERVEIECKIVYNIGENGWNVRQCTVRKSSDRMYDSVQYRRKWMECKIVYSIKEQRQDVRQCTVWKSSDRI